uniref:LYR motif-containing protein 4 n=1 Tax=Myxine glutinosa TaxID=7769 RepID=UPI00358F6D7D
MASSSKLRVLGLYRALLRESRKFPSYNYREYAVMRVRDAFREHTGETDPNEIHRLLQKAQDTLEVIRRQVVIGHLYSSKKLVIEGEL